MSRPRNIGLGNLLHYRFPLTAITSILHRITGVLLVISIPFWLWALMVSLSSPVGFAEVKYFFCCPALHVVYWLLLSVLSYHIIAGVKHLLMDAGHFETKEGGKTASVFVLGLSIIVAVLLGVWLW
jgi:succinate dehydrogenase / fumarate reductase cytochrome b subunit